MSIIWADLFKIVVTATVVIMLTAVLVSRRQPLEAPKPKRLTFRIDDIPIAHIEELPDNLRSVVERDPLLRGDVATLFHHSLAPKNKRFVCATVSITTPLSGEDLCVRMHRAGKCYPYSYSCKFDGITPLYEDENGPDVDVIAVTGLGGHALGSWKSRNGDEVWLRDFLPEDIPNIRVLLYGYDSTLPGSLSKQSIGDLGSAFLEQVTAFRANDGTSRRPTILIGHSLGGLLIKEALIRARRRRSDADSDLYKACFGLLFFGVPNLGLRNEQLRTLVQGQPNQALIDSLLVDNDSEPSAFLNRVADQFSESCKGYYRVVTFFERALSPTLKLSKDRRWCRTGPPALLVTERSATSTGLVAVADEDNIPLNTDHSGLVKYSFRNQGDYPIVRERLRRFIDEAKLEVPKRFSEHSPSPTPSPNPPNPPVRVGGIYALLVNDEEALTVLNPQGEVKLKPWENPGSQKQEWKVEAASCGGYGFRNMFNGGLLGVNPVGNVEASESRLREWERFSLVPVIDGHRFIVDKWWEVANQPLLRPDLSDYLVVQRAPFFGSLPFFGSFFGNPVTIKVVDLLDRGADVN